MHSQDSERYSNCLSVFHTLSAFILFTVSDLPSYFSFYRNSTKPCEMILQYSDDDTAIQIADSRKLSDMIMEITMELHKELATRYHRGTSSSPESSFSAKAEKTDVLFDPLNEMLFLLKAFGNEKQTRGK